MTTPSNDHQDSSSERIEELLVNTGRWGHISCAVEADPADGFGYCSCGLRDKVVKPLTALIAQDRKRLLERIEGELPKKKARRTYAETIKDFKLMELANIEYGFNQALSDVQSIINAIRESI